MNIRNFNAKIGPVATFNNVVHVETRPIEIWAGQSPVSQSTRFPFLP